MSCACCAKAGTDLRCSRCKVTNYCSRQCQRDHWQKHKLECKPAPTEPAVADLPIQVATATRLLQNANADLVETTKLLERLCNESELPNWGWDLVDPLVTCLIQRPSLHVHLIRVLRRICEVCAPSEIFLSLLCHLTSAEQAPGLDLKLELLKLVTSSLLPRVQKNSRRVVDFAEQMSRVIRRQLQSHREMTLEDYASFYHAARDFVTTLDAPGADLGSRVAQLLIALLEHRFELDRLEGREEALGIIPELEKRLPADQAMIHLEQKNPEWEEQGLALYLSFQSQTKSLLPLDTLLFSPNPLVFGRGVVYARAVITHMPPSLEGCWPVVKELVDSLAATRESELRQHGVALLRAALQKCDEPLLLLQRAVVQSEEPCVSAVLLHQYKEFLRLGLDAADEGKADSAPDFSGVVDFLLQRCLNVEESKGLQWMVAKCDIYCAALNCYRFLLLRDKNHATRVQITATRDIAASIQPLLLAVEKAQKAVRTLPSASSSSSSSEIALSRLQMVEELARRAIELGQEYSK